MAVLGHEMVFWVASGFDRVFPISVPVLGTAQRRNSIPDHTRKSGTDRNWFQVRYGTGYFVHLWLQLRTDANSLGIEQCKNITQLRQAHANSITCGLGTNHYTLSRLLAFYSNPNHHNTLIHGLQILHHTHQPTNLLYNTMIKACLVKHQLTMCIVLHKQMVCNNMYPDNYTLPYVLKACGYDEKLYLGMMVHGHCVKLGFGSDGFVGNTLVLMYCLFGEMGGARRVFDEMPRRCVVSWTVLMSGYCRIGEVEVARAVFDEAPVKDRGVWGAMISGYVQNNCFKEGLHLFRAMQSTDIRPDEAMFVSVLGACAHLGALEIGVWVHKQVNELKMKCSTRLGTALMDMYCKCGKLDVARKVFDEMPERDIICFNVMISGLAIHGEGVRAIQLFSQMETLGFQPDDVTFIAVFTACSYSGVEHEGLKLFNKMRDEYNINPKIERYVCIIDLLGRAGLFTEAKDIIQRMPSSCNPKEVAVVWRSLLSACQSYKQTELAQMAAERIMELENDSGVYVLMSNLYSSNDDFDSLQRTRKLMRTQGVEKVPGCSCIKIGGGVYEFVASEKMNHRIEEVHKVLESLSRQLD
ncbi:putative pentatricopeptide repeat-containing protein At5g59200, chloroplastic [Bidens hawaiensis]|uniref:putative pentatricopeptide repeat-containing protein At5g59200, chloroplastic n=1 Tax=Bidens hawaiensis TaxID=980011 RepID=UPI00404AE5F4